MPSPTPVAGPPGPANSAVLRYFREEGNRRPEFAREYRRDTGVGSFWVSSLPFARNCLAACLAEGLLGAEQELLDAGAGDFRVCLVASELGLRVTGVEANADLVRLGRLNIAGVGLGNPPRVIQADFRDLDWSPGVEGAALAVYNFANQPESAARLLLRHGGPASTFILYDGARAAPSFPGLEKIRTFAFAEVVSRREQERWKGTDPEDVAYAEDRIHIYAKRRRG